MGHALNVTIQDILCRFERLRGRDVLWQPGTDHAGIATQMVVERLLAQENKTDRPSMGREAFVRRVWEWKNHSGGQIAQQLRRLGASCDWSRERFTMDEGLSRAVVKVFVQLHKQGRLKDRRLVNWDPKLLTAISDLEVLDVEVKGQLWYFRYPLEGSDRFVTVAATRPETMLGDTGIAVHPDDERYRDLVGQHAILPLVGRRIPIVADAYSDPEKGTGAVKITPAHDFNDFEVARRHALPMVNILAADGTMALRDDPDFVAGVPRSEDLVTLIMGLHGADRFEARVICQPNDRGRVARERRAPCLSGAAWRPLGRGDRAVADRAVVCRCRHPGAAGHCRGRERRDLLRPQAMGEDLFRMDAQHPALVGQALVGASIFGLVRPGRDDFRCGDGGSGTRRRGPTLRCPHQSDP